MLRLPAVCARSGYGTTTLYARCSKGLFAPPVKLTPRASAWPEHEVDAVLGAMLAGATDDELRSLVRQLVESRATHRPAARA